jgi:RNA polymerase sigma factor (TIGR02999 family)
MGATPPADAGQARGGTAGPPHSSAELLALVYDQLRAIAQQRVNQERTGHTLQATALVHEVYLRLAGERNVKWESRAHFFAAAGEAMRRILIEHARSRGRVKRGGDGHGHAPARVPLGVVDLAEMDDPEAIVALDEAFCRLEREEPEVAAVVRLRLFAGQSVDDTATALGISPRSVDRTWAYARAWLFRCLKQEQPPEAGRAGA